MVPASLPECHATALIRPDGRPAADFRERLRRIPSWRNAWSVVFLYAQTSAIVWATVRWAPWVWPLSVLLMGRAFAQFASLMHEAAHRLLFTNKRLNDIVGRWLLGFPSFTSTDVYRRVHMAHHRDEFGPDEPDIPLYIGYPIDGVLGSLRYQSGKPSTIGELQAWDLNTGKMAWVHKFDRAIWAPLLTTGGNLVFTGGTNDKQFRAFDATNGKVLWQYSMPSGVTAVPSSRNNAPWPK